ncbi:50S ribosomal protein L16 [Candidatus Woesebacteria bacterium CG_4_10_14_0_2_um_filter_39_14]|uniref:Large ribosomal subunit protein uL16 n=3 Tax=Candidatus Woeseibacteriota TaxID=1752722 RepID=A0A2M7XAL2_9BACT|nr:MAG: 50S ribosomal protein L16 [Candidatus Woesebacteria bacterium CG06_land_8_20_14_3_00_39_27]PIZ48699.1 MAG: 50S ribosomal protein L16 [Candidatus Woesebacteria bacterium CG_4_10_14_0_2_um_filter_39_14]PJA43041.1 MAG: 50S ribosomal protein L16 [Candidatus Woesebacteria bacterium CG_4_9_14_3_um_filter_39_10]
MQPKRRKYIKDFRGKMRGVSSRGAELSFGEFGLKAQEVAWVTGQQIEAARRAITHELRKGGRVWIRIFPDKPVSAKPAGKRMGGGKGDIAKYVVTVRPGRILFEVAGATEEIVKLAFARAAAKLPIKTKFITAFKNTPQGIAETN